jgi:hypothetical protein
VIHHRYPHTVRLNRQVFHLNPLFQRNFFLPLFHVSHFSKPDGSDAQARGNSKKINLIKKSFMVPTPACWNQINKIVGWVGTSLQHTIFFILANVYVAFSILDRHEIEKVVHHLAALENRFLHAIF